MKRARKTIIGLCAVAIIASAAIIVDATQSHTLKSKILADDPKIVRGWVWDTNGLPVEGAEVTVNIKQGETVRSTEMDTTNDTGFYSVTFWIDEWDVGETIEVIADYSGDQVVNSTEAEASGMQFINATLSILIPEFGEMGKLLSIGGTLAIFSMVVFARKRRTR